MSTLKMHEHVKKKWNIFFVLNVVDVLYLRGGNKPRTVVTSPCSQWWLHIRETMQYDLQECVYMMHDRFTEHLCSTLQSNRFKVADILNGRNSVSSIVCTDRERVHFEYVWFLQLSMISRSTHSVSSKICGKQGQKAQHLSELIEAIALRFLK